MNTLKSVPRRGPKKAKQPPRVVEVVESFPITPNMQRVVLSGDNLVGFPPNRDGANFKIFVPKPGQSRADFENEIMDSGRPSIVRTFTVGKYDAHKNLLTIDFALHEGAAPAGDWAKAAESGSFIGVTNGGEKKVTEFWGKRQLLAGDMTALPAMEALLRDLPTESVGDAIFEVTSVADQRTLPGPKGIEIHWLTKPDAHRQSTAQLEAIKAIGPKQGTQISAAGEHSVIAAMKSYFFDELGFDPSLHYLSPYWKIGLVEEEHQALKRSEK